MLPIKRQQKRQSASSRVRPGFSRDIRGGLVFWATPGLPRPVWTPTVQPWTYPLDTAAPGLFSANAIASSDVGLGVVHTTSAGFNFKRYGTASDAYIEIPSGSDFTWLFETADTGFVGTNPGWIRGGPSANSYILFPSSGLWVGYSGTGYTSAVARPAAGSTIRVVVSVKSGAFVRAWVNGIKVIDSTTAVTTAAQTGTNGYNLFGRHNGSEYLTGITTAVGLWHRAIEDNIARELSESVSRAYAPRTIWVPVSAGGGGTSISGALGTAAASGLSATVNANRTIAAALGTASASGLQATVSNSTDTTITGALGTASASGFQATVDNSNDTTVNGSLGTAAASGFTATVNANRTIAAGLGTATASGFQAGVTNDNSTTINGTLGTAVASGFTAGLNINRTVLCSVGEALALGHQATIQGGGAIAATGGGGWLPSMRRKTRKQIHDERVKLGILPADVVKAAKKAAAVVADEPSPVQAYKQEPEQANKVFLRSLGASKMLPDYTKAIQAQIEIQQREDEDLMLFF